jgi:hypothetical protein
MWTLPIPSADDVEADLTAALTYKNGQAVYLLSQAERRAIMAVYTAYDDLAGQPGPNLTHTDLGDQCCGAIEVAYNEVQAKGRLADLRARLLLAAENCPICGFGEPTQLDHYLPKATYKSLAIYPRNLVPCCGPCNTFKLALDPARGHALVHAYYAELPDHAFLVADANYHDSGLTVEFRIDPANIDPGLVTALNFQLTRLKLNERYPKQINTFLFGLRTGLMDVAANADLLREFLQRTADSLAQDFGRNDWRPVLLAAIRECSEFCERGIFEYFARRPRSAGA